MIPPYGRRVLLVEEPIAASLGAGMAIDEPAGSMVLDIGGGTSDIGVMSLGDVVQARSLRCAGNAMDEAIVRHVRRKHELKIGIANAERIKIEAGTASVTPAVEQAEIHIRGRDLREGRPKTVVLGPADIAEALDAPIEEIADFVQRTLEDLPPEVSTDICERGITLTGGGALLDQLSFELERRVGVPFTVPDNPMQCVVRGAAKLLDSLKIREHLLIKP
ncbi:MAG TPA: rod shape-determining protein [Hyphomicrobiaceae bacterium]|nr:rod shape-determining protein [Hyphomicrobiaceae bacterium]